MDVPDYLHPHVGQLLGIETEAAIMRTYWAVVLGLRPFKDGDRWCVLWGPNIQEGIVGFGKTPKDAMNDFDSAMTNVDGKGSLPKRLSSE